ncbi:hypothetical protein KGF57_004964 [Candida theae]|uniref:Uncharacterized protein n=1 Tax=Candida theae TaxID=1198502 RepID=A0AAD5FWC7_9ASCO|nr:uncharacterized protein KGF57_004964 [Candida theae]KAI5949134.1 hypothetical protein KGF57_004964 [Candida theae]
MVHAKPVTGVRELYIESLNKPNYYDQFVTRKVAETRKSVPQRRKDAMDMKLNPLESLQVEHHCRNDDNNGSGKVEDSNEASGPGPVSTVVGNVESVNEYIVSVSGNESNEDEVNCSLVVSPVSGIETPVTEAPAIEPIEKDVEAAVKSGNKWKKFCLKVKTFGSDIGKPFKSHKARVEPDLQVSETCKKTSRSSRKHVSPHLKALVSRKNKTAKQSCESAVCGEENNLPSVSHVLSPSVSHVLSPPMAIFEEGNNPIAANPALPHRCCVLVPVNLAQDDTLSQTGPSEMTSDVFVADSCHKSNVKKFKWKKLFRIKRISDEYVNKPPADAAAAVKSPIKMIMKRVGKSVVKEYVKKALTDLLPSWIRHGWQEERTIGTNLN